MGWRGEVDSSQVACWVTCRFGGEVGEATRIARKTRENIKDTPVLYQT